MLNVSIGRSHNTIPIQPPQELLPQKKLTKLELLFFILSMYHSRPVEDLINNPELRRLFPNGVPVSYEINPRNGRTITRIDFSKLEC